MYNSNVEFSMLCFTQLIAAIIIGLISVFVLWVSGKFNKRNFIVRMVSIVAPIMLWSLIGMISGMIVFITNYQYEVVSPTTVESFRQSFGFIDAGTQAVGWLVIGPLVGYRLRNSVWSK